MASIRHWAAASALAAAVLAGCGGSDPYVPGNGSPAGAPTTKGTFTSVVSFGDSLSDAGTYSPATSLAGNGAPPYFGGKYTTNGTTATVWVENVASSLGIVATPAIMGFAGNSTACPAALQSAALATTCTLHAQGGARVTNPDGIGKSAGQLTVPVVTQVANHLSRFSSFKASDLVFVWAGHNDVFSQFGAFGATATQVQTQAATGAITADQANALLLDAQLAAQAEMKKAALELVEIIKSQILAKGGKYVAVINLADISVTPFGKSQPAAVQPVLAGLSEVFNLWLREGLTGQPVLLVDAFSLLRDVTASPAKYGLSNVAVPACDAAKISALTSGAVTNGASLFCNATTGAPFNTLAAGADPATWLYADGVHPTTGGYKVTSDEFIKQLRAAGWL